MKPTAHSESWLVYTSKDLYSFGAQNAWRWTAHGPRGDDSGVEADPEAAIVKAQCAAELLAEPRRRVQP